MFWHGHIVELGRHGVRGGEAEAEHAGSSGRVGGTSGVEDRGVETGARLAVVGCGGGEVRGGGDTGCVTLLSGSRQGEVEAAGGVQLPNGVVPDGGLLGYGRRSEEEKRIEHRRGEERQRTT